MQQIAIVRELHDDVAVVEVSRKSACEGCHANIEGNCSACVCFGDKKIVAKADNTLGAAIGDRVVVESNSAVVLSYAAAVFLFPLLLGVICFFIGELFPYDAAPYVGALVGFFAALLTVRFTLERRAASRLDLKIVRKL